MSGIEFIQGTVQGRHDALITAVGEWVKNIRLVRFWGWGDKIQSEINLCASSYNALLPEPTACLIGPLKPQIELIAE
jgi:hypothetical protein